MHYIIFCYTALHYIIPTPIIKNSQQANDSPVQHLPIFIKDQIQNRAVSHGNNFIIDKL